LKNPTHKKKRAGAVAQGAGPEFKSQYHKKKKERKEGKKKEKRNLGKCRKIQRTQNHPEPYQPAIEDQMLNSGCLEGKKS
jgi:hypothetical protein